MLLLHTALPMLFLVLVQAALLLCHMVLLQLFARVHQYVVRST
jgi:hypothetical protein